MNKKRRNIRILFLLISVAIYIVSLTQTAIIYNDFDGEKAYPSYGLLIAGIVVILGGGFLEWFVWLANPLYFLSLIFLIQKSKTSKKTSVAATILAGSFIAWKEILVSENGRTAAIVRLNIGYWLWLISLLILTIGTIYYFEQAESSGKIKNP